MVPYSNGFARAVQKADGNLIQIVLDSPPPSRGDESILKVDCGWPFLRFLLSSFVNLLKTQIGFNLKACTININMPELQKQQAKERSVKFESHPVLYTFTLQLNKSEDYEGLAEIQFRLKHTDNIYLDLKATTVEILKINGQQIQPHLQDQKLSLPTLHLKVGRNRVLVRYKNRCSTSTVGLLASWEGGYPTFHTQFEPDHARDVFPVFDQPDIRAQMKLNIVCAEKWKVVSNEKQIYSGQIDSQLIKQKVNPSYAKQIQEFVSDRPNGKIWIFPQTKVLPTYLFCFCAGTLCEIPCPIETSVSMSLYSTPQYSALLQKLSPLIFQITAAGMKFFQSYYKTPFQFPKYDQLFVRNCSTAMENAGISIFRGNYLRVDQNDLDTLKLCRIILHELCHHWFGNLVTMEYWDDTWLKEGITTFMEDFTFKKIVNNLKHFKYNLIQVDWFFRKENAFAADTNTHSLHLQTVSQDDMYDSIIYNKGGAIFQQFQKLIGEEAFSSFCSQVLETFKWGSWSTRDFVQIGQKYLKKQISFEKWVKMFVETPGYNTINSQANYHTNTVTISQVSESIRYYETQVILFRDDCTYDTIDCVVSQKQTTLKVSNLYRYKATMLDPSNSNYFQQAFSPKSTTFFKANIHKISSELIKSVIYMSLFKQELSPKDFSELYLNLIGGSSPRICVNRYLSSVHTYLTTFGKSHSVTDKIGFLQKLMGKIQTLIEGQECGSKKKMYIEYNQLFKQKAEELELELSTPSISQKSSSKVSQSD